VAVDAQLAGVVADEQHAVALGPGRRVGVEGGDDHQAGGGGGERVGRALSEAPPGFTWQPAAAVVTTETWACQMPALVSPA